MLDSYYSANCNRLRLLGSSTDKLPIPLGVSSCIERRRDWNPGTGHDCTESSIPYKLSDMADFSSSSSLNRASASHYGALLLAI